MPDTNILNALDQIGAAVGEAKEALAQAEQFVASLVQPGTNEIRALENTAKNLISAFAGLIVGVEALVAVSRSSASTTQPTPVPYADQQPPQPNVAV